MFAKQITVFIENRTGRLSEVLSVLGKNGINIISLSLADTTEFGLLRLIVDKPAVGKEKLTNSGFSSLLSEVSIIKIPHKAGSLQELLDLIDDNGINIEYMYGLSIESDEAYVVMKSSEPQKLDDLLEVVNKENVGFVITNEGKDDLVLCPAKWFDLYYDDDFGCIINSAVRYSLGRSSYMPSTTVKFVLKYLMVLDVRTITVMIEDINRSLVDEQLPYKDTWLSLKYALEDRLEKMQEGGGKNG